MKKSKSSFRDKVTRDSQRQKTAGSNYGYLKLPRDIDVFKEEPGGRIKIDILPYMVADPKHPDRDENLGIAVPGELWYKRPFKIHRNIGGNNETAVCLTSVGKKCPICNYRAKRLKEGADKEETDSMKASMRNLYLVIPVGNRKFDEKIMVWDISQYLFQNLLNDELDENPDYAVFPDLEEGLSLRIRFDSRTIGKSQPFAEASRIDFFERETPYEEKILKDIPCLDDMLNILSYDELEAKFFELEEEEEPEPRRPKKKISEVDDEDDDESPFDADDEDEEEEEEPEPEPVRKKKPVKKEEPEEEDEEEDEEDEEPVKEKPAKKKTNLPEKETPTKPGLKNKCPKGFVFGKDCEKYDECDACDVWDECIEEQDRLRKKK